MRYSGHERDDLAMERVLILTVHHVLENP